MSLEITAEKGRLVISRKNFSRDDIVEVYRSLMEAVQLPEDPIKVKYVKNTLYDEFLHDGNAAYNPLPRVRFVMRNRGNGVEFEISNDDCRPVLDPAVTHLRNYFS